uniref:Uncharacterized protein n=1 Tax=Pyrodinium bahamense TaxID=73915 RepID=A0A7S0FGS9_9DINO|mmetsp:Transcript_32169/g.88748  ORF Transcript_32169/g.88748 Transcript_32169/m.88748 type:complete len:209 (+) Transcript_32169:102-728(+)
MHKAAPPRKLRKASAPSRVAAPPEQASKAHPAGHTAVMPAARPLPAQADLPSTLASALRVSQAVGAPFLHLCEHLLHEGVFVRHVTARHIEGLDDTVIHDNGEALAPGVAKHGHGRRSVQDKVQGLREFAARVGQEGDHGTLDALVLGPALHHSTVVDAVDENLIDALRLQLSLLGQVPRHLLLGSDGREGTRQPHNNGLLSLQAHRH